MTRVLRVTISEMDNGSLNQRSADLYHKPRRLIIFLTGLIFSIHCRTGQALCVLEMHEEQ